MFALAFLNLGILELYLPVKNVKNKILRIAWLLCKRLLLSPELTRFNNSFETQRMIELDSSHTVDVHRPK